MKRYISIAIIAILLISTIAMAAPSAIPASDTAKDVANAQDKSPVIGEDWSLENPKITVDWTTGEAKADFIHYKEPKASNKQAKVSPCYKTFAKWPGTPVTYNVNPTNPQGLDETFVTSAISNSAEVWDDATVSELFNPYTLDYTAQYGIRDDKNSIDFGPISDSNTIAVTSIWYNFFTKQIFETDMRFNTRYTWGDATVSGSVMDLQNIGTHEFGHVGGMDDIYKPPCGQVTMYGYSGYGETNKRSLEAPDVAGIRSLYG